MPGMSRRCPECLVWKAECICSDPDYRPHGNLGSKRDYMRRNMRIAGLRADERNGLLRRDDRRLVEGLRAICDKLDRLDRLIRAVESLERASGVPHRVFGHLEKIEDSCRSMSHEIAQLNFPAPKR